MKRLFSILLYSTLVFAQNIPGTKGFGFDTGNRGSGLTFDLLWPIKGSYQAGVEGRFYDIKNEGEFPVYDYYTSTYRNVDDRAMFMIPLFGVMKYFPFEGKIANNFSPFLEVKAGTIFTIDGNEIEHSFSKRWQKAPTFFTIGGQLATGVDFRYQGGTIISGSIAYDIFPLGQTVDGQSDYSGMVIQIGFAWSR
ncbi:MAG: hypothetical protein ACE5D2_00275 [Fidelibacterota bacterium]